jgi:hypothetical protein
MIGGRAPGTGVVAVTAFSSRETVIIQVSRFDRS